MVDNAQDNREAKTTLEASQAQPLSDEATKNVMGGHMQAQGSHRCLLCKKRFANSQAWQDHMVMVHGQK